MIQGQVLSYVLNKKDASFLQDNNIDESYFLEYKDEYEFIHKHIENYKNVPDIETFIEHFPDFDILDVNESERYLVDTIREEALYAKSVPVIKRAAELLKSNANDAGRYLQSEIINLVPNYTTPYVDIIHSESRANLFEDKSTNPEKWYIQTGFQELDDVFNGGWQKGEEFGVIFARTNQGKSWVLCKVAQHAWLMGENVGYISPEMTADKIGYRFDTLNQHLSNKALLKGDISEIKVDDYRNYLKSLQNHHNKFIVSTPSDFNKQITVSKLRSYIMSNKLGLVVIDGITYMTDERGKRGDNKTTTLTNISEDLIQLSVDMQVPIIVVVQSNREGVRDSDDTPDLENIRDSDGIAHNATKVISLKQKDGCLVLEVKKNRDNVVGTKITYNWDIDTGMFRLVDFSSASQRKESKEEDIEEPKQVKKKERRVAF